MTRLTQPSYRVDVYHMPARHRTVPLSLGDWGDVGVVSYDFPNMWLLMPNPKGEIVRMFETGVDMPLLTYADPLGEERLFFVTDGCLGAAAMKNVRDGDLHPVAAFWNTYCTRDRWWRYANPPREIWTDFRAATQLTWMYPWAEIQFVVGPNK